MIEASAGTRNRTGGGGLGVGGQSALMSWLFSTPPARRWCHYHRRYAKTTAPLTSQCCAARRIARQDLLTTGTGELYLTDWCCTRPPAFTGGSGHGRRWPKDQRGKRGASRAVAKHCDQGRKSTSPAGPPQIPLTSPRPPAARSQRARNPPAPHAQVTRQREQELRSRSPAPASRTSSACAAQRQPTPPTWLNSLTWHQTVTPARGNRTTTTRARTGHRPMTTRAVYRWPTKLSKLKHHSARLAAAGCPASNLRLG